MKKNSISRRKFIFSATTVAVGSTALGMNIIDGCRQKEKIKKDIVSIVRVKDGNISKAVEEAIDLLPNISFSDFSRLPDKEIVS